jgi:transcription antitermination factor NusG
VVNGLSTRDWFALRIRSRCEKTVAANLNEKGYEVFLPLYRCKRRWSDRVKEIEEPLFPGYLFCRLDLQKRLPILVTPHVLRIVGTGKMPVPVDATEITALQSIVKSGLEARPWPFLRLGQRVRVLQGPLCGVEGTLVAFKRGHRLVVSVTLLQRSVAVEIDHDWVAPPIVATQHSANIVAFPAESNRSSRLVQASPAIKARFK